METSVLNLVTVLTDSEYKMFYWSTFQIFQNIAPEEFGFSQKSLRVIKGIHCFIDDVLVIQIFSV